MRETIASLKEEIAGIRNRGLGMAATIEKLSKEIEAEKQKNAFDVITYMKRLENRDKDIAALKAELARAQRTIAMQQGYIARALEDDNMRELGPTPSEQIAPMTPKQSRRMGIPVSGSLDGGNSPYRGAGYAGGNEKSDTAWHDR